MAGFLDFLMPQAQNAPAAPAPVAPPDNMAGVLNPVPPEVQQLNQPTANPAEVQARTQGWMEVVKRVTSDPNLMRAVGYFGTAAMQPMAPGQSTMGHLGQALMLGRTAYDFGQDAAYQRALNERKLLREEKESDATIGLRKAQTAGAEASTVGQLEQNEITRATKQSTIDKAREEVELTKQRLANAKTEADKLKIELDAQKRREAFIASVPGAEKAAVLAELQKPGAELKRIAAQTGQAGAAAAASSAHARLYGAQAAEQETENKDLANMTPEERRQQRQQKRAGANVSAQVQSMDRVAALFKQANPSWNERQVAQAVLNQIGEKKSNEREMYIKWAETNEPKLGETPQQHVKRFRDTITLLKGDGEAPASGAAALRVPGPGSGRGTAGPSQLPSPKTQEEYNALPKGAQYVGSDGQVRTKR